MRSVGILGLLAAVAVLGALFYWLKPVPVATSPVPSSPQAPLQPKPAPGPSAEQIKPIEPATTPQPVFSFAVKGGRLEMQAGQMQVQKGQNVEIRVTSDTDNQLHLHGYNLSAKVLANQTTTLRFNAAISGRFGLELHHPERELGALEVLP